MYPAWVELSYFSVTIDSPVPKFALLEKVACYFSFFGLEFYCELTQKKIIF